MSAWDDAINGTINGKPRQVSRQSILDDIYSTVNGLRGAVPSGYADSDYVSKSSHLSRLKDMLNYMPDNSSYDGGSFGNVNPFGVGAEGGAPTMSTSNRFESGLTDAETRLRNLLDNPDSIQQSAAYKFRVGQGAEALQRSLGAKGLLNSGNRLMELTKYGQDMGSQEYDAQAGRLGNLLGNYSQSWIGDKNANTGAFSAQANAWNTAQANADQNRYRMGSLAWEKQKGGGGVVSRSSGGMTVPAGTLGGIGGSWDPEKDPGIARLRQASIDAQNY